MNPNLMTNYEAIQAERSRLDVQAEPGWLAEQATATCSRRHVLDAVRHRAGRVLVRIGKHLQNVPPGAPAQFT